MEQLRVGMDAPNFEMEAVLPNKTFGKVSLNALLQQGKWVVLFFYPMDFTLVCPTEITAISDEYEIFKDLDSEIIGVSTDTIYSHLAWINIDRSKNGLGELNYPLAADPSHKVSKDYGVLIEDKGSALRALFIINPEGKLQYQVIHDDNIGRNVDEVLRVLQALQTGGVCPANWRPGDETI